MVYEPLPAPMQLEVISEDLRREVWNLVWNFIASIRKRKPFGYYFAKEEELFFGHALGRHLNKSIDEIECSHEHVTKSIKAICFDSQFNKLLDLLEIFGIDNQYGIKFRQTIKNLFESHGASCRLDISNQPCQFIPCSTKEQGDSVEKALESLHERGCYTSARISETY